jgi:hypothetical protein
MARPTFPVGTKIIAVKNIGKVREGALGVITGVAAIPFFFWTRQMYLCTFAGNYKIAVRSSEIDDFDHGYNLEAIENPDFMPDFNHVSQRMRDRRQKSR